MNFAFDGGLTFNYAISGAIGALYIDTLIYPLKRLAQVQTLHRFNHTTLIMRKATKERGLIGLWTGFAKSTLKTMPRTALAFGFWGFHKSLPIFDNHPFAAGASAGACASLIYLPLFTSFARTPRYFVPAFVSSVVFRGFLFGTFDWLTSFTLVEDMTTWSLLRDGMCAALVAHCSFHVAKQASWPLAKHAMRASLLAIAPRSVVTGAALTVFESTRQLFFSKEAVEEAKKKL